MDTFFAMDIQRAGIQVMETVYIIGTSKNIDTIKSRYSFLLTIPVGTSVSVLGTLQQGQSNREYSTYIQMAIDQYKTIYPGRVPQDYQLAILSNPNRFDLNEFYCNSLVNAMKRFCGEQAEEIRAFKKEAAKTKRIAKVIETIQSTKNELQAKCSSASSFSTALAELEKLASTFNASL